ncbi:hypothetical protein M5K25_003290 [Dendrobium thyrsiflorum]|uniref:Uncharacterized protein n=1 Tax=Dendrobium thyrsiflorum TaxID=117978 RepID=A0ABD0VIX6_DENTH
MLRLRGRHAPLLTSFNNWFATLASPLLSVEHWTAINKEESEQVFNKEEEEEEMGSFTNKMLLSNPNILSYSLYGSSLQLRSSSFSNFRHPVAVNTCFYKTRPKGVVGALKVFPETMIKDPVSMEVDEEQERIESLVREIKQLFASLGDGKFTGFSRSVCERETWLPCNEQAPVVVVVTSDRTDERRGGVRCGFRKVGYRVGLRRRGSCGRWRSFDPAKLGPEEVRLGQREADATVWDGRVRWLQSASSGVDGVKLVCRSRCRGKRGVRV